MTGTRAGRDTARPPGPPGHPVWGHTLALAAQPLEFMRSCCDEFGDVVHLRVRGLDVLMVSGGRGVREVLVDDAASYRMDRLSRGLGDALGDSLLVGDGPDWRRRRAAVHQAFGRRRMDGYDRTVADLVAAELDRWLDLEVVDVSERMSRLAVDVLLATVIGLPGGDAGRRITADVHLLMRHVLGFRSTGLRLPIRFPTPGNRRARRALDRMAASLVPDPVAGVDPGGAAALLAAHFAADGRDDPASALTDELITLLLVGHETVATALAYACRLLAARPRLQDDLAAALGPGDDAPAPSAAERVPLLRAVIRESLRLYPPVWAIGREARTATTLDGYRLRPGDQVVVPVWAIHHQRRWYDRPDEFRPERWLDGGDPPEHAFLPFGSGVRRCIGERFAHREMAAILAALVRGFRLEELSPPPVPAPSVTLRPRRPVVVLAERRTAGG